MTAIQRLQGFLADEGLTTGYTIKRHHYDDADPTVRGSRVLFFREDAPGSADVYVQEHVISVYVMGSSNYDRRATVDHAAAIARACRTNTTGTTGAFKIKTLGNPTSPFQLGDDRPVVEVVVRVWTEDT